MEKIKEGSKTKQHKMCNTYLYIIFLALIYYFEFNPIKDGSSSDDKITFLKSVDLQIFEFEVISISFVPNLRSLRFLKSKINKYILL